MEHHLGIGATVVKWHAAEVGNALTPSAGSGQAHSTGSGQAGMGNALTPTLSQREREFDGLRASGHSAVTFVLSTDDVDRHGDVVSADGWRLEAYLRNPVLLWAHDYRHPAIGRAVSVWTEPHRLLAKMEFAPGAFAQEVAALYACGFQWGVSVGFRPIRWEERRDARTGAFLGLRYLEQELLEVSAVPVPANREALRRETEFTPTPALPLRGREHSGVARRRRNPVADRTPSVRCWRSWGRRGPEHSPKAPSPCQGEGMKAKGGIYDH